MYCPVCGQQQISEITRFCSRCGFLLTGVAEVIANKGSIPFAQPTGKARLISPRKRGLLQGLFILLIGMFLIVPILGILTAALNAEPFLVAIASILSLFGGILRMLYALLFEEGGQATVPNALLPESAQGLVSTLNRSTAAQNALPPQSADFTPTSSAYVSPSQHQTPVRGNWRDANTGELVPPPPSITESTTKLLQKDE